jgi:hypothetical protein
MFFFPQCLKLECEAVTDKDRVICIAVQCSGNIRRCFIVLLAVKPLNILQDIMIVRKLCLTTYVTREMLSQLAYQVIFEYLTSTRFCQFLKHFQHL